MSRAADLKTASEFWNARARQPETVSLRWWQSKQVLRHVNKKICGQPMDGFAAGVRRWLRSEIGDRTLDHAISVGCGSGGKEIWFIQDDLVNEFDLFEISQKRVDVGVDKAQRAGLADRMHFFVADAFTCAEAGKYDLVHWDSAMHHMLDVPAAVEWSWRVLKPGGYIVINDYIGPDRFQISDRNLEVASRVLRSLPQEFLENGSKPGTFVPRELIRVAPEKLKAADPTEAADSSRIVPSVSERFRHGRWVMLGGGIYHIGINDLFWNFERFDASSLLDFCLIIDDLLSESGENLIGAFLGRKL